MYGQVIAEHLFHEGKFSVGEQFIAEAGVANGKTLRQPYEAMHNVLTEVSALTTTPNPVKSLATFTIDQCKA